MRYELKSVGLWAFFKVTFLLNLIIGFFTGLLMIPFVLLTMWAESVSPYGDLGGSTDDVSGMVLVLMPFILAIVCGVGYTILGLLMAAIYNLFARFIGGFEFTLESAGETSPSVPATMAPPPRPTVTPPPPPPRPVDVVPLTAPVDESPTVRPTSHEAGAGQEPLVEPQPSQPSDVEPAEKSTDRRDEASPQS